QGPRAGSQSQRRGAEPDPAREVCFASAGAGFRSIVRRRKPGRADRLGLAPHSPAHDRRPATAGQPLMNDLNRETLDAYYAAAESWSEDRVRAENRSRRIAWIVAGIAALIAAVEAF